MLRAENGSDAQGSYEDMLAKDIEQRIASALDIRPELVRITDYRTRYLSLFLQCWGVANGVRIFAKVFLVESYPTPARYANPIEELAGENNPEHPVEEQMAAEWRNFQQILELMGPRNIPKPLACSVPQRTLVYEVVEGRRVDSLTNDHAANLFRPRRHDLNVAQTAIRQAARWLRSLHDSTAQGFERVSFRSLEVALQELLRKRNLEGSSDAAVAQKVLAMAEKEAQVGATVQVPVAMNHGDFTLANVLWDEPRQLLWIIDFEQLAPRSILHDLSTMIFTLRKELLHPLASWRVVSRIEDCFWDGYGEIPADLRALVNGLATARLFYLSLPKLRYWGDSRGIAAGVKARVYVQVFRPIVVRRVLRMMAEAKFGKRGIPAHCEARG